MIHISYDKDQQIVKVSTENSEELISINKPHWWLWVENAVRKGLETEMGTGK